MKRTLLGLAAITLAGFLSSFSLRHNDHTQQFYWFHLDPDTGWPMSSQYLIYQSGCPDHCELNVPTVYCDGAYTSYTGTGPYYAAGNLIWVYHDWFTFPPSANASGAGQAAGGQ